MDFDVEFYRFTTLVKNMIDIKEDNYFGETTVIAEDGKEIKISNNNDDEDEDYYDDLLKKYDKLKKTDEIP